MNEKIKALIWEECRVGGVVALWTMVVGMVVLLFSWIAECNMIHSRDWTFMVLTLKDDSHLYMILSGTPFVVALLLILNLDYSGIMRSGFSRRILNLPVPTAATVTVSLSIRTVYIFLVSVGTLVVANLLFSNPPSWAFPFVFVTFYLLCQFLDWLRQSLSGLTSFLIALPIAWFLRSIFTHDTDEITYSVYSYFAGLPIFVWVMSSILLFVAILPLSIYIVRDVRIGNKHGIPEIWTWHHYVGNRSRGAAFKKPFASALRAQVWLHLRRSKFLLPLIMVLPPTLVMLADSGETMALATMPIFGMIAGCLVQGAVLASWRHSKGMPGYTLIQPLNTVELAYASIVANAALFLPTLVLAVVLHFYLPGTEFMRTAFPSMLEKGLTSYSEIAWILVSRGVFLGLLGWNLLALPIGTIAKPSLKKGALVIGAIIAAIVIAETNLTGNIFFPTAALIVIAWTLREFWKAIRLSLIGRRSVVFWGVLCALCSIMIFIQSRIWSMEPSVDHLLASILVCIGLGALIPLPFISTVNSIHQKRHSAQPTLALKQVPQWRWRNASILERGLVTLCCLGAALALCFSVPREPAYVAALQAQGLPATSADLNAADQREQQQRFGRKISELHAKGMDLNGAYQQDRLERERDSGVLVENDFLGSRVDEAFEKLTVEERERYWNAVVKPLMPELKAFLQQDCSGYLRSVDYSHLKQSYRMDHVDKLHHFYQGLNADLRHWIHVNQPNKAVESIQYLTKLSSIFKESSVQQEYSRGLSHLRDIVRGVEDLLSRCTLKDVELKQLQNILHELAFDEDLLSRYQHSIRGERAIHFNAIERMLKDGPEYYGGYYDPWYGFIPIRELCTTTPGIHLFTNVLYEDSLQAFEPYCHERSLLYSDYAERDSQGIIINFPYGMYYWRGHYDYRYYSTYVMLRSALVGVAIERYRLVHGDAPETLDALVPDYLEAVPEDLYIALNPVLRDALQEQRKLSTQYRSYSKWTSGSPDSLLRHGLIDVMPEQDPHEQIAPLRYIKQDNGDYIVYGIGFDLEDDGGYYKRNSQPRVDDVSFEINRKLN